MMTTMSEFNLSKKLSILEFANSLKLPKSSTQRECYVDDLAIELGLIEYEIGLCTNAIQEYYIIKRHCTDTHVGVKLFYWNKKFIGYAEQEWRKSDKFFYFVKEEVEDLKKFIVSLIPDPEYKKSVPLIDEDHTVPAFYQLTFSDELLNSTCFLEDGKEYEVKRPVKNRLKASSMYDFSPKSDNMNLIVIKDGKEQRVHIEKVWFKTQIHP